MISLDDCNKLKFTQCCLMNIDNSQLYPICADVVESREFTKFFQQFPTVLYLQCNFLDLITRMSDVSVIKFYVVPGKQSLLSGTNQTRLSFEQTKFFVYIKTRQIHVETSDKTVL